MSAASLKILFLDVGGVLLNNGWGHESREKAARQFGLNYDEMEVLHNFIFNVYEMGKITLDDYLNTVVFNHPRDFSRADFKEFMFAESCELPDMLQWLIGWKRSNCGFRIISINNEGIELNQYRIDKFRLHDAFDAFVSSGDVGMRKPDPGIFRLAMGIAQARPDQCVYFDDRLMLARAAGQMGILAHHHRGFATTKKILEDLTHTPLSNYDYQPH